MFKYCILSIKYINNSYRFIFTFILSVVFILNCTAGKNNSAADLKVNREIGNNVFQILLWQGGGFTGLKKGFTLSSTGEIIHWQRHPGQADSVLWIAKGHASDINKLKNKLDKSGALEKQYNEYGNMTVGVTYKINDKNYTWTWSQTESEGNITGELQDWYQNTLKFCQSLDDR